MKFFSNFEMLISDNPTERIMDNSTETTVGGVIVLVTDGMSSTAYGEISTIIPSLQKDNIRVVTIAFGLVIRRKINSYVTFRL